jgi:D-proline reductase (dithiol) PrdB
MEVAGGRMATYSDLRLKDRLFMAAYRFRSVPWAPGARLPVPLSRARIALVTTAAFYLPDQRPFDEGFRGGDYSYREIPTHVDPALLKIGHRSGAFDHRGIQEDKNLALPIDRFLELERTQVIGVLNHRHYSFMGSLTATARLVRETAPEVAERLAEDGVQAVFLTPV